MGTSATNGSGAWRLDSYERLLGMSDCGARLLALVANSQRWVHRRVEAVAFEDDQTIVRRVSIDFTVPDIAPALVEPAGAMTSYWLPLGLLLKRGSLIDFDLRDGHEDALSLLSRVDSNELAMKMLEACAAKILGPRLLDDSVRSVFEDVLSADDTNIDEALKPWRRARRDGIGSPQVVELAAADDMNALVELLAQGFFIFVCIEASACSRHIVKIAYKRTLDLYQRKVWRLTETWKYVKSIVGWRPAELYFPVPAAEYAHSFHFQLSAPTGLTILKAELRDGRDHVIARGFGRVVELRAGDVGPGSNLRADVTLSPDRNGWMRISTVFMWMCSAVLLVATWRLPEAVPNSTPESSRPDAVVLLLLTLVVIMITLLVKPDEHALTTQLLVPSRRLAAVAGFMVVLVSFSIVFWPGAPWLHVLWLGALVVAVLASIAQTLAVILCSPAVGVRRERRAKPGHDAGALQRQLEKARQDLRSSPTVWGLNRQLDDSVAAAYKNWTPEVADRLRAGLDELQPARRG